MLKSSRFKSLLFASALLSLMVGGVSTKLSANTITMANYTGGVGDVTCTPLCLGFVGVFPDDPQGEISLSLTDAQDYNKPGSSNETVQLGLLNDLLGLFDPARASVSYVAKTDDEDPGFTGNSFTTNRQYFSIKQATEMWFFENLSGGTVTVNLENNTENFSNWTEYGAVVPVPAAFWLFGTALIGFIGFSRRTKI
jgi:hypothetical protein